MTDILTNETGRNTAYWMARVQTLIEQTGKPITDPKTRKQLKRHGVDPDKHTTNDPLDWLAQLAAELMEAVPADRPVDGNMWLAKTLGFVLAVWYARLAFAKAHDPVRPVSDRRRAYDAHHTFTVELLGAVTDVRHDATFFPRQKWESPFDPAAKSGSYR